MAAPEEQLSALRELTGQLADQALDYWLSGGWAVDFYVGHVSRPHGDIVLAVWERVPVLMLVVRETPEFAASAPWSKPCLRGLAGAMRPRRERTAAPNLNEKAYVWN